MLRESKWFDGESRLLSVRAHRRSFGDGYIDATGAGADTNALPERTGTNTVRVRTRHSCLVENITQWERRKPRCACGDAVRSHRAFARDEILRSQIKIKTHEFVDPFLTSEASCFMVTLPMQTRTLSIRPMFRASERGWDCVHYLLALGNQEKDT